MEHPNAYQGLEALAARRGWRRLEDARRGEVYLSERTVYRDTDTGGIVWRMTNDPAVDVDDYYDIPSWNADGSVLSFLSWRGGRKTRWLMDANGGNIRPMPVPAVKDTEGGNASTGAGPTFGTGYWSVIYRDRFYYSMVDEQGTHVMALNPFTGESQEIVCVEGDLGQMMPPHPKEEHFLFGKHQDRPGQTVTFNPEISDEPSWIHVVGVDGTVQTVELERRWHRLRFTKGDDLRIFFNYDNPRTQWTILPDGSERQEIPFTGGHPDWLPDGSELTYYAEGAIWGVRYDGSERREVIRLESGGHGGPCRDGVHFVSDTGGSRPGGKALYPDAILYLRTDGSGVAQVLTHPSSSFYAHSQLWHPDHHSTHAHPVASPDGTKTVFNSDALGEFSDIYVAVNRLPDPPRNLVVRVDGRSLILNWEPPEQARELLGYNVYRFDESTLAWKRLTFRPQRGTGWRGPQRKEPAYYVVTAVEHSGLESRPSNQVYQMGNEYWEGFVRFTFEAEAGRAEMPMCEFADMAGASNLYYVGCHGGQPGGSLTLDVTLPKSVEYRIWARVKGSGALAVAADATTIGSVDCTGDDWHWVALDAKHMLMSGDHALTFTPTTGGECLDKILVTDDDAFVPLERLTLDDGDPAPDTPTELAVEQASANALRLRWKAVSLSDLDHYNVYCAEGGVDVPIDQAHLVGSPVEAEFVDWGLRPGIAYRYRVTTVDRSGNESAPSDIVEGTLAAQAFVRQEFEARRAKRQNVDVAEVRDVADRVAAPNGRGEATLSWKFKLPADGSFALWGLSMHRRGEPSVFDVFIDDEPRGEWRVWGRWGQWVWSPMGDRVVGSPQLFDLTRGGHTLRLVARNASARVARVVLTDDPTWWPVKGFRGENLSVE